MKSHISILLILTIIIIQQVSAQTIYVDGKKGDKHNNGSADKPYKTLGKAVREANKFTGQGNITIKLMPGVYTLKDKVSINPLRNFNDTTGFTIEAYLMPGDTDWAPHKMPVIQSVSGNNSTTQFPHAAGLYIASDNVSIRGIKFGGNANPKVPYYYPINMMNSKLKGLTVSQCYFIGDRNSAAIQGGIWVRGQDVRISNCVFKECRNAILVFQNSSECSITHNIITDAYESAFWIEANGNRFYFNNNVVSNCNYFWVDILSGCENYPLTDCIISENDHYLGKWNREINDLEESDENIFTENNIVKKGVIEQVMRTNAQIPKNNLHLSPESVGYDLNAGIQIFNTITPAKKGTSGKFKNNTSSTL